MPKKEQQCMESCKKPSKVLTGGDKRATLKWSGVVIQKMGHFFVWKLKTKSGYRGQRNEDGWKRNERVKEEKRNSNRWWKTCKLSSFFCFSFWDIQTETQ